MKMSSACKSKAFYKNGFALRLALKQRHKGTQKWPIISFGNKAHCKTVLVASLSQLAWEYREIELRAGGEGINHLNFVFPEKFHVRTDEENTLLSKMTWQSLGTV